jgi:hypothetical protein
MSSKLARGLQLVLAKRPAYMEAAARVLGMGAPLWTSAEMCLGMQTDYTFGRREDHDDGDDR